MNNTPDNNTNIPAGSNKRSSPLLKVLPIAVLAAGPGDLPPPGYKYISRPQALTPVY